MTNKLSPNFIAECYSLLQKREKLKGDLVKYAEEASFTLENAPLQIRTAREEYEDVAKRAVALYIVKTRLHDIEARLLAANVEIEPTQLENVEEWLFSKKSGLDINSWMRSITERQAQEVDQHMLDTMRYVQMHPGPVGTPVASLPGAECPEWSPETITRRFLEIKGPKK